MNKSIPQISGIYSIVCLSTGKVYIGSAVNIRRRWHTHRFQLRHNKHYNLHLQSAWNKYGETQFSFQVFELCEKEVIRQREQHWLDTIKPYGKRGFNISQNVEFPQLGRPLSLKQRAALNGTGRKASAETKKLQSENAKNRSLETRTKLSIANKGKKLSSNTREKISTANKGKKFSEKHLARKSAAAFKRQYIITNPNGNEFWVIGLTDICRENGLSSGAMCSVAQGKRSHHKGWKVQYVEEWLKND